MRVIAGVNVYNTKVVQSKKWKVKHSIGSIRHVLKALDRYEIDEIIINNIRRIELAPEDDLLREISHSEVFTPLTLGGGVRTVIDFDQYYKASPERLFFSSALMNHDEILIQYACSVIGQQGMVAFLPFRIDKGEVLFFNPSANKFVSLSDKVSDLIKKYFDEVVFYNTTAEGEFYSADELKECIDTVRAYSFDENGFIYGGGVRPSVLDEIKGVADAIIIENSLIYQEEPLKMNHIGAGL